MLKVIKELKSINMLKISKRSKVINISRQRDVFGSRGPVLNIFTVSDEPLCRCYQCQIT